MKARRCAGLCLSFFLLAPVVFLVALLVCYLVLENPYTTARLVTLNGYPLEKHEVTTDDGYVMEIHRIRHGLKGEENEQEDKPVVLVHPGLLMDSACFVSMSKNQSLGFILADAGLDVWLGNSRGTTYGLKHTNLSSNDAAFWDFSWEELAEHEIPSIIDYVLNATKSEYLYYVGNSQSGLAMMTLLSERKDYNEKVRFFFAMAPAASFSHVKGPMRDVHPLRHFITMHHEIAGPMGVLKRAFTNDITRIICSFSIMHRLCERAFFRSGGPPSKYLDFSHLQIFYANYPDGTSSKNILHYTQMIESQRTARFNYGEVENMKRYGLLYPPSFNYSNIVVPMKIWYSPTDYLVGEEDIVGTVVPTLNKDIIKDVIKLNDYNHFDFHWGIQTAADIYYPIANDIRKLEKKQPKPITTAGTAQKKDQNRSERSAAENDAMCFSAADD